MPKRRRPDCLQTQPIDDRARNGGYQLAFCAADGFAVARWVAGRWLCSTGNALEFDPVEYRPHARQARHG